MKTRTKRIVAGAALGLGGGGVLAFVLGMKRPEILSMGTVAFVAGCLTLGASALLLAFSLRFSPEGFSPGGTDRLYILAVTWCWLSYAVSTDRRGPVLQPFLLIAGLVLYLLVRAGHHRYLRPRRALWAWLLVAMVGIEALHGLRQFLSGVEMKGLFFNANYLAMFLALAFPLALALAWQAERVVFRLSAWAAAGLFAACIILTGCRTALAAILIVAGLMAWNRIRPAAEVGAGRGFRRRLTAGLALAASVLLLTGALAVASKPTSAQGRVLIWKVSLRMFLAHPALGTGFSSFAGLYGAAQGSYFRQGLGTPMERLSADSVGYAFNDYLETAVELGLVGLLIFAVFWFFVLEKAWASFQRARASGLAKPAAGLKGRELASAAAGSVVVYMIMSFFYFPSRILPTFLLFNVLLAWVVSENAARRAREMSPESQRGGLSSARVSRTLEPGRVLAAGVALAGLIASLALLPSFFRQFQAERTWEKARVLLQSGKKKESLGLSRRIYPDLRSNDNFLIFYSRLLMSQGIDEEAVRVLERRTARSSNPYLWEKLAEAYAKRGDIAQAWSSAFLADSVLPWRLTSKAMLTDFSAREGDLEGAVRYARLVLETPMKLWTEEGQALKEKAFAYWAEHRDRDAKAPSPKLEAVLLLPSQYRARALAALDAAGANAARLIQVIGDLAPEEREGLGFLLVNMPDRDLKTLSPEFLTDNVTYAYRARRETPWAGDIPEDIFLNYVLPYAVADEPRDDWRRAFYGLFRDGASASGSFDEAVMGLNRDVFLEFRILYAERDNRKTLKGPLGSIRIGSVSCGEASVLLVDACRAVGIPARLTILRRWGHMRGGHIWVEVYDHDRWRYLVAWDAGPLDRTWMTPFLKELDPADPQQHVYAVSFQKTGLHILFSPFVSFVDVSANYKNARPEMK
jgi:O-antigen ligase